MRHTVQWISSPELVQRELAASGIANPSPHQLRAALMGGALVGSSGRRATLPGVLTLRSQGMGWGRIARTLDVPMGRAATILAFNHDSVPASGSHAGKVSTAGGEVLSARRWSDDGNGHVRTGSEARPSSAHAFVR